MGSVAPSSFPFTSRSDALSFRMLVNNQPLRTVWQDPADWKAFHIIDQRALPFRLITERMKGKNCSVPWSC